MTQPTFRDKYFHLADSKVILSSETDENANVVITTTGQPLSVANIRLTDLAAPTAAADACNKTYVDGKQVNSSLTGTTGMVDAIVNNTLQVGAGLAPAATCLTAYAKTNLQSEVIVQGTDIVMYNGAPNSTTRAMTAALVTNEINGCNTTGADAGQLRLSAGGQSGVANKTFIDMYGYNTNTMDLGTNGVSRLKLMNSAGMIASTPLTVTPLATETNNRYPVHINQGATVSSISTTDKTGLLITHDTLPPRIVLENLNSGTYRVGVIENVGNQINIGCGTNGFGTFINEYILTASLQNNRVGINKTSPVVTLDVNGTVQCTQIQPNADNNYSCGTSGNKWSVVYAGTATINTSDRTQKKDIRYMVPSDATDLLSKLKPCWYKFNQNSNNRDHSGFISQDVRDAVGADFASNWGFYIHSPETVETYIDGEGKEQTRVLPESYGLRYSELVSVLCASVQDAHEKIDRAQFIGGGAGCVSGSTMDDYQRRIDSQQSSQLSSLQAQNASLQGKVLSLEQQNSILETRLAKIESWLANFTSLRI